jgi:RNA polymerase sigma-70 factor (ECF subfamily)
MGRPLAEGPPSKAISFRFRAIVDMIDLRTMTAQGARASSWGAGGQFAATRWSIVLAAGGREAGTVRRRALEELAHAYWLPLYAYIRRQGSTPEQAEDLTQGFFTRLLEKESLASVDRSKGKFRSFLLASLKHFLANERDKARARKRGGGTPTLPLDRVIAEACYRAEPVDDMTPERVFERRWAVAVLDLVISRLQREYVGRGQSETFESLSEAWTGQLKSAARVQIASRLGMTEGAINVAIHRLRRRYRNLLRDEIAQTVSDEGLIDEEIQYLLRCL